MQNIAVQLTEKLVRVRVIPVDSSTLVEAHSFEEFDRIDFEIDTDVDGASVEVTEETEEQIRESELQRELEVRLQKAYDDGFTDGKEVTTSLMNEVVHESYEKVRRFDKIALDLHREYRSALEGVESSIVDLALALAGQILDSEMTSNSQVVVDQARRALNQLSGVERVVLKVNPSSYSALVEAKSSLVANSDSKELVLLEDESVEVGGCILETPIGEIDAQIRTQFLLLSDEIRSIPIGDSKQTNSSEKLKTHEPQKPTLDEESGV